MNELDPPLSAGPAPVVKPPTISYASVLKNPAPPTKAPVAPIVVAAKPSQSGKGVAVKHPAGKAKQPAPTVKGPQANEENEDNWELTTCNPDNFEDGMMFVCTKATYQECMTLELFGLPYSYMKEVGSLKPNKSALFLFNQSNRRLYGVFEAVTAGGENLDPNAWGKNKQRNGRQNSSPFPAQVRFKTLYNFQPLADSHVRKLLGDAQRIRKLTQRQVANLIRLFHRTNKLRMPGGEKSFAGPEPPVPGAKSPIAQKRVGVVKPLEVVSSTDANGQPQVWGSTQPEPAANGGAAAAKDDEDDEVGQDALPSHANPFGNFEVDQSLPVHEQNPFALEEGGDGGDGGLGDGDDGRAAEAAVFGQEDGADANGNGQTVVGPGFVQGSDMSQYYGTVEQAAQPAGVSYLHHVVGHGPVNPHEPYYAQAAAVGHYDPNSAPQHPQGRTPATYEQAYDPNAGYYHPRQFESQATGYEDYIYDPNTQPNASSFMPYADHATYGHYGAGAETYGMAPDQDHRYTGYGHEEPMAVHSAWMPMSMEKLTGDVSLVHFPGYHPPGLRGARPGPPAQPPRSASRVAPPGFENLGQAGQSQGSAAPSPAQSEYVARGGREAEAAAVWGNANEAAGQSYPGFYGSYGGFDGASSGFDAHDQGAAQSFGNGWKDGSSATNPSSVSEQQQASTKRAWGRA